MQTASEAKFQVLKLKHLPPLSSTAASLLELLADENLSLGRLSKVISQDPAITARILGVANSAYFGQTTPIHSVEDAVIRVLGLNMVKSLAFSIAVSGAFDTRRCHGFDLKAHWFYSLATATLSRLICRGMSAECQPDPDELYLAGLLFDLGTLVLVHLFPDEYAQVLKRRQCSPQETISAIEESLVGITSRKAGAWLIARWHLPDTIVRVIEQTSAMGSEREVALVGFAADWVRQGVEGRHASSPEDLPLMDNLGLSASQWEIIKTTYLREEDELHAIAGMLAN
jgi:HD-like signal output (HDOD) protein